MPRYSRKSEDTVNIDRGNYESANDSQFRPVRRSSTLDDRSLPNMHGRYAVDEEYRPQHRDTRLHERPKRSGRYPDDDFYGRWEETLTPFPHYAPPARMRRSAQSQMVDVRTRPRSPSLDDDDDDRHLIPYKDIVSEPVPPFRYPDVLRVPMPHESQHVPGSFQTVFDVNHPQDASIYLELPLTDDHETELEVFSRLQRLGNFSAAQDYFNNNLESYVSNPYVFVHFGQMLLDKGDYQAFEQLNPETLFGKEDRPTTHFRDGIMVDNHRSRPGVRSQSHEREQEQNVRTRSRSRSVWHYDGSGQKDQSGDNYFPERSMYDEFELLRENWRLLKATSIMHTNGTFQDAFTEAWCAIENFRFGAGIGSTEVQVVMLALQLCAQIGRVAPEKYYAGLQEAAKGWIDWPSLVKELFVQGRIWDFKDLYVAALAAFSSSADELFFGTHYIKRSLIEDWVLEAGDESTNLAQLDLLLESARLRPSFLDEARSRAEAIMANSPAAMKSQAFIRWILANAADALHLQEKGEDDPWLAYKTHLQNFPGMMVWHSQGPRGWTAPSFYVPRNGENPGWVAPDLSRTVIEPCQLALNLAKELDDYKSQVACYKLLISQSQDPTGLLQELAHLQNAKQGDRQGHLETLLSTYLICKDRPAKEKLLRELEQTDDWGDAAMLRDRSSYWARDFIERGLNRNLEGPKSTAGLRNSLGFYMGKGLPFEIEQFTRQNAGLNGIPPTSRYPLEPHSRQSPVSPPRTPSQVRDQEIVRPLRYPRPYDPARGYLPWSEPLPQPPTYIRDDPYFGRRGEGVAMDVEEEQLAMEAQRVKDEGRRIHADAERMRIEPEAREQRRAERERQRRQAEASLAARESAERRMAREREERDWEAYSRGLEEPRQEREFQEYNARMRDKPPVEVHYVPARLGPLERERRAREDEQIEKQREFLNAKQKEEERRANELERLILAKKEDAEAAAKRAQTRHEQEVRDRRDREVCERLKQAELSLQDHSKRLKRAEDLQCEKWLAGRTSRSVPKTRGKTIRVEGGAADVAMAQADSESYYSDSSSSQNYDDSSYDDSMDDTHCRQVKRKGKVTRGHSEQEQEQGKWPGERKTNRKENRRGETSRDEANDFDGNDNKKLQQNSCTALVLYSGVQSAGSPDASMARSPLQRPPTSPVSLPNEDQINSAKVFKREQMRQSSRGPSVSGVGDIQERGPALEQARTCIQEQIDDLPAKSHKAADHPVSESQRQNGKAETWGHSSLRETEIIDGNQPRSREQNERISNRPPRVVADSPLPTRKETDWDKIVAKEQQKIEKLTRFEDREIGEGKPRKVVVIDVSPSDSPPLRSRPGSLPIFTQERGDNKPLERRTSWRDGYTAASQGDRFESETPKRRSSLIVDADGRPQLIRTSSEHRRSYIDNAANRPHIRVKRGDGVDRPRSVPELSLNAAGKRPQRPVGSRSQSTEEAGARYTLERQSAETWEKGKDGPWTRTKNMSTLREDPTEVEEPVSTHSQVQSKGEQSSVIQSFLDPEPGISRKPTVTDVESDEE